jgi:hypothetical protein
MKTSCISADCVILNVSWNMEGTRLITSGEKLQIWELRIRHPDGDSSFVSTPPPKPIPEVPEDEGIRKKCSVDISLFLSRSSDCTRC